MKSAVVSIQGVTGSFHHIAAERLFPGASCLERDSFDEVFEDVKSGRAGYGILAIENSIAGSLLYNYDRLARYAIPIVGETYLRIVHNLIAAKGTALSDIREVRSHPMALQQCQAFLKQYPFKLVEKEDTAGEVRKLSEKPENGVAAIASSRSAEIYGMEIIAPGIETDPHNYTRFLMISPHGAPSGASDNGLKSTIHFAFNDGPGTLVKVLNKFAALNINMSKIESRPRVGAPWQYEFFVDLQFDFGTALGKELFHLLREATLFCNLLGTYRSYGTFVP
jgi:prephenate dehydratase